MQIALMLVFLFVWLFVFWIGSIALEATGMRRDKARFQALSAITGTGFTTREAESVVNHSRRRRIVSWIIVLGNTGILAFIIGLILFLRSDITAPTPLQTGIIVAVVLVIILFILFAINRRTDVITRALRKRHGTSNLIIEEIMHQAGDYGIVSITVSGQMKEAVNVLRDIGFSEKGIIVMAIERPNTVLSAPALDEKVMVGDSLLCYGKVTEMISLTG